MKKYTVVLLRPEYYCEDYGQGEDYGQDIYVAHVEAETKQEAITKAQKEVFRADKKDGLEIEKLTDYKLCVLFSGHAEPAFYGWQHKNP